MYKDKDNNIEHLQKWFQPYVKTFIEHLQIGEWKGEINEGYRSCERQDYLYAQGRTRDLQRPKRTNAQCNQSDHQFGRAVDIIFFNEKRVVSYEIKLFQEAWKIAQGLNKAWKWGGNWWTFRDYTHFYMEKQPDIDFIAKFKGQLILDVEQDGRLYYIDLNGFKHYLNPKDLETFNGLAKLAVGMKHIDALRFPDA